MKTPAN